MPSDMRTHPERATRSRVWLMPAVLAFLLGLAALASLAACGQGGSGGIGISPTPVLPTRSVPPETVAGTGTPATRTGVASYETALCTFNVPLTPTGRLSCGWVTVPEMRSMPGGRTIRLHVAVIKSHSAQPAPDPLVFLAGGPGERAIDAALSIVHRMGPVLATRDIVVFDQRGAGYSQPSLDCPERDPRRCRDRLVRQGINLEAYTNNENADDVNDLRLAMGYGGVNLYGGSYGTLLALTVIRRHPEGVRSAVLDSVVPPQISIDIEEARAFERSLDKLFAACASDQACNAAYPHLRDTFYKLVVALNSRPVTVHLRDEPSGLDIEAPVSGGSFAHLVWYFMQYSEALPSLPRLVHQTARGDLGPLSEFLRIQATAPDRMSEGMQLCVACSCMIPFQSQAEMREAIAELRPELREAVSWPGYDACEIWKVPREDPKDREPVRSDVPALLLTGQFDPLTPPEFADMAAETLSRHSSYVFPATGHGVVRTSDCAWQMMSRFLEDPTLEPGDGCLGEMLSVEFVARLEE